MNFIRFYMKHAIFDVKNEWCQKLLFGYFSGAQFVVSFRTPVLSPNRGTFSQNRPCKFFRMVAVSVTWSSRNFSENVLGVAKFIPLIWWKRLVKICFWFCLFNIIWLHLAVTGDISITDNTETRFLLRIRAALKI